MKSLHMSRVGLGTVKFGRNTNVKYPQAFELPDDACIQNLLGVASDLGINLLDTAPAYGNSETRLGKLLGKASQNWVIVSKAGETYVDGVSRYDFTPRGITQSVEASLSRLRREYLDVLLIHSNGDDAKIIEQDEVFVTLDRLKTAGKIRFGGLSSKTVAGGIASLNYSDCVMATYHIADDSELPVLDYAMQVNKPVFIKKALGSGHHEPAKALHFIAQHPGDNHVILGTINPDHLCENVQLLQK